ncbi:MAG: S8 family serine peptidase, partial [Candidatus Eiseniibacteriota bacterium]
MCAALVVLALTLSASATLLASAAHAAQDDAAQPFATTWSVGMHDASIIARDLERLVDHGGSERAPDRVAADGTEPTHLVWVGLTDKGIHSDTQFRAALRAAENALSDASRARRLRAGGPWIVDYLDIPVPERYVAAIAATGATVRVASRWLAAVSVEATAAELHAITELPFVARLTPVARGKRREPLDPAGAAPQTPPAIPGAGASNVLPLDYGPSLQQLEQIQVTDMHALGYTGAGVIVCMLDTGYFKDHEAFATIQSSGRLLAEWDFINDDGNTQNEPGDSSTQHNHGTLTWSTLGGEKDGELYGPAYGATFVIGKTEDVTDEYPLEEDFFVAGLEWADGLGAQVVSSSLGYTDWYTYEDMDGQTAVTTNGCDIAASRNILVCTAAGNEGSGSWYYMIAPADGDSVVAVGAVDSGGDLAWFSSHGPTYDGRTKPEVCARGIDTWCATPGLGGNDYTGANGTSLSTPLVGGVAALLMEARPAWSAMQVREAMMMTADNASAPDNDYGWGVVQTLDAMNYGSV